MAINQETGWSVESKLLQLISKELEKLAGIISKASGGSSSPLNQISFGNFPIGFSTDTLDVNGVSQHGKNVIINNGVSGFTITVNGVGTNPTSYQKEGTGSITFVQGAGRTLRLVDGTAVWNGLPGSTATIASFGTVDSLRISNA